MSPYFTSMAASAAMLSGRVMLKDTSYPVFAARLSQLLTVPYSFAPAHMNRQRAAAFAMLAFTYLKEGKCVAAKDHAPEYLRLSQAEREKKEKEQG